MNNAQLLLKAPAIDPEEPHCFVGLDLSSMEDISAHVLRPLDGKYYIKFSLDSLLRGDNVRPRMTRKTPQILEGVR